MTSQTPTVYYGLSGEGLGHARRALPILEHLRQRAHVVVLASGQATEWVRSRFCRGGVGRSGTERCEFEVRSVAGYRFQYNSLSRVSIGGTLIAARRTAALVDDAVRSLTSELVARTAIVISDFEPITIRAAEAAGVPSLSIDHQRFLQACQFNQTPPHVRGCAEVLRRVIDVIYGIPQRLVVSGFYLPPLKREFGHARLAGVTIRQNLLRSERRQEQYLVAYVRHKCPTEVERTLARSPLPVFMYGTGRLARRGNLHYCESSDQEFSERLAACRAVVSTAGNQLIGEAFYLGKPVLAFPEPGNPEQHINAALLRLSGGGSACSHRRLTVPVLEEFLARQTQFDEALQSLGVPGNRNILSAVDEFLNAARDRAAFSYERGSIASSWHAEPDSYLVRAGACT